MTTLTRLVRRAAFWLHARRHAADLAAEIEHHRARMQASLESGGLSPAEAAVSSRRAMGNVTLAREDAREIWAAVSLERAWRDLVYGARALRRERAFAGTALITLTLGIGMTTTVFIVADAEMWRPLPFPAAGKLVAVHAIGPGTVQNTERVSAPDFLDWQASARLAEYAATATFAGRTLRRDLAERVSVQPVTPNYFNVLGGGPRIGRAFQPGQDDRAQVAVLSDRGWRRLFNANPGAVGTTVSFDGAAYAIVGAFADQSLGLGSEPDFYIVLDPAAATLRDRTSRTLSTVIGRVRDDAGVPQAQAELQSITAGITKAFPQDHEGHRVELEDLRRYYSFNNSRTLFFFLGAAAIVLLLACVNVANLLLARALRRQREFAIRGALGGGRGALIRHLVVEGALIAVPSAVAGTLLSFWAVQMFVAQVPDDFLGRSGHYVFDARIASFVILICGVTTMLLSMAPLVFARRVDVNLMLGRGGRTAGRTPSQIRARNGLLVAQLTLTLVLMVAAGLFVSSFAWLLRAPLGFDPQDRLALRLTLSGAPYDADAQKRAFADRLLDAARAIPGVNQASIDSSSPLLSGPLLRVVAADRPRPRPGDELRTIIRAVSPDYFSVLGVRQILGRPFSGSDINGAPRVAIVNEYLAAQLFPAESAVGKRLELVPFARQTWTDRPGVVEIVGVIANARDISVEEVQFADVYVPYAQAPSPTVELIVHASIPPDGLAAPLRNAAATLDPNLPVARMETLQARVRDSLKGARFNLILIGSFAAVAILLACVGIYGAMACAVQERAREFGVRLALGQPPAAILRGTVWQSARFGLTASALGIGVSLIIARLIGNALYLVRGEHNGLLHGVTTTDPVALASAAGALILIATLAGVIPARQATSVDPLVVLRSE
jgi:putative ABC transport system permease protein